MQQSLLILFLNDFGVYRTEIGPGLSEVKKIQRRRFIYTCDIITHRWRDKRYQPFGWADTRVLERNRRLGRL